MFSRTRELKIEQQFKLLMPLLGGKKEEILEGLKECNPNEALAMKFLYTTMPLSDIANYSFKTFLDYAKHGVYLWEHKKDIPEDIFLNYVLHHRINEEEISSCRTFLYHKIKERVQNKSMKEGILEVNYWCSEEATYQSTDERTVSPMTVYKSAYGRCGEESTFTVSALRSVGIPARQVYAPRWSHCDDNHAWVEVWCEGEWYFLGACEPEEILNKGWFTNASSRAMLIHSRWFDFIDSNEECIEHKGMATILNHLKRYAVTKKLTIKVVDEKGMPVSEANVDFEVLNYAEFYPIASGRTNERGEIYFTTGLGSLHIHVSKDGSVAQEIVNTKEHEQITILLGTSIEQNKWVEFEVIAPVDAPIHSNQPTLAQKIEGKNKLAKATEKRREKVEAFYHEPELLSLARGNAEEIIKFNLAGVSLDAVKWKESLLKSLTVKDYRDCKAEILIEHLQHAVSYASLYEADIFTQYILNPRIACEPLSAYRKFILAYFTRKQKEEMRENPKYIWETIKHLVEVEDEKEYPNLTTNPIGSLQIGRGSKASQKILFVAICRTLGIPARLNSRDSTMEYYEHGEFVPVLEEVAKSSICCLRKKGQDNWEYFQNWSLAKLQEDCYTTLNLTCEKWEGELLSLHLQPGRYRIITSNRLPNGNIFSKVMHFTLEKNEMKEVELSLKEAKLNEMLECISLFDFEVIAQTAKNIKASTLSTYSKNLWIWLEESKEPTEHILNEIYEKQEQFKQVEKQIIFVVKNKAVLEDPTLKKILSVLKDITICYDDFQENINTLARRMYVDPDKLPLIMITDSGLKGIYATSGYNVGTADMLLRIFNA